MAKKTNAKIRQDALLALIPPGTKKVQVKTELGQLKYKSLDEISDTDEIQTKSDGTPVVMTREPGRKKAAPVANNLPPATPVVAQIVKQKAEFIEKDPVFRAAKENPDNPDVLHQVVLGLTQEAASLAFERSEAERKGEETSNISIRRVNALKAIADSWLKRKEQLTTASFDMDSPAFRTFFKMLSQVIKEAMESSGIRDELIETVFAKAGKAMDEDWQNEVKNRIKAAT